MLKKNVHFYVIFKAKLRQKKKLDLSKRLCCFFHTPPVLACSLTAAASGSILKSLSGCEKGATAGQAEVLTSPSVNLK